MDSKSEQSKILVKNAYFHSLEPQNRKIYRIKKDATFNFTFKKVQFYCFFYWPNMEITVLFSFVKQISPKNQSDCTFIQQFCIKKTIAYLKFRNFES
jgi:hypothetical protein